MTTGTVVALNPKRGMVAVKTDDGGHSIFEMLGDDPTEKGDRIRWAKHYPLGRAMVENLTQHSAVEVFFQNHDVSTEILRRQLGLSGGR